MPNNESPRIAVPEEVKRDISILASTEGRYEYEIVADALKLYKAVSIKRGAKNARRTKDVISHKDNSLPKS